MIPLILETDSSRVVSMMIHDHGVVPQVQGVTGDQHSLSHHGQDETKIAQLKRIEAQVVGAFGDLLTALRERSDGGGPLLDSTTVLFGSNLGNANAHTPVDLPILLGLIAFILNYVPTIGSILASVPALILALINVDPVTAEFAGIDLQHAAIVGLGYVTVNVFFGNWLEPILMGRHFGLSTLIVVVSLFFWGWLWGPVGAVLSVPLTMVVKIMLENTRDLQWIAVLLDKSPPPEPAGGPGDSS
jgi:hypothetical protein